MANLLYLVHRMPYPPNKGDKVRSYHLLKHLAAQHRVFLGTFIDDPDDAQYLETVRALCADVCAVPLRPGLARVSSLAGLVTGDALTLGYYSNAVLQRWVSQTVKSAGIDMAVVFSSAMAPYLDAHAAVPLLLDLVDVDSAKWTAYADARRWPLSWLYRREGQRLLAFERAAVQRSACSFLVTQKEVELFLGQAPEAAGRIEVSGNGVDADYFSPAPGRPSPFDAAELPLVFTGAMDYWPNVDAVCWFATEVLPQLRVLWPRARLHVVGRNPTVAVQALAGEAVSVTGTVADVRPYLQHATVVVAPLRLARGVQNKVLEAMAMARPVVTASTCAGALTALPGQDLLVADEPADYVDAIDGLLQSAARAADLGAAARRCVLDQYSWAAKLAGLDRWLAGPVAPGWPAAPSVTDDRLRMQQEPA